ncbi:unnamed protein product, partial [Choristocarpus tenellus]
MSGDIAGRVDNRLFLPVLRTVLEGEGDLVLRRSLLCHPLMKMTKANPQGAPGSGSVGQSRPTSSGRRKGSKGSKTKKHDREKELEREASRTAVTIHPPTEGTDRSPLDVPRELRKMAVLALEEGSLQSLLILVKTLMCSLDASGDGGPHQSAAEAKDHKETLLQGLGVSSPSRGTGNAEIELQQRVATPEDNMIPTIFKTLVSRGLSGWPELMSLLRRERHKERMLALRGRPSLTVCYGKADIRGRLEAKGDSAGVVTGTLIPLTERRRWYYEVTLVGPSKGTRVGWALCGETFSRGDGGQGIGQRLGCGSDSWGFCGFLQGKSYHGASHVKEKRLEAAARARREERKQREMDDAKARGVEGVKTEDATGEKDNTEADGASSQGCGAIEGKEGVEEEEEEEEEEDTADSMFLALGGLFREASFSGEPDQEVEDGGHPVIQVQGSSQNTMHPSSSSLPVGIIPTVPSVTKSSLPVAKLPASLSPTKPL